MWSRVDLVWTDVSEERFASIFRAEKSATEELAWAGGRRYSSPSPLWKPQNLLNYSWLLHYVWIAVYSEYNHNPSSSLSSEETAVVYVKELGGN
jgi:hypothetical protein